MINVSTEYQLALPEKKRFIAKATCLLKDGTTLNFDKTNLMGGGIKITDGTSSSNKFDMGAAIINQLTVMVYNEDDVFSDYDFSDAVLTVWVGMPLADRIEWLKKGVYNASDPTTTPSVITLKALDNMSKFDTAYDGNLSFPATLQSIVQYCCSKCGVLLVNGEFPNYAYTIQKNPFDEKNNVTYRAIISYCALLAGCYARCNVDGRLELKWYDTGAFGDIIDGGIFDATTEASYQTGDSLDGGNFTNYSSGDTADGGTFTETLPYHHIYSFSSLSVSTEDVVITGIRVTAADSEDNAGKKIEGETYLCGAEGYVLDVSGNPLVENGKAKTVAEYLAGRVVGMRFRPFQANVIGDPSWEAGDAAIITDRKGNSYHTYLTNITYSTGGYASISCDAEPAARHSADRYSEIEQIVSDIKKDSQHKLSSYAEYVNQLNSLAINAMGYYETNETQDDGSVINYMHDKPLLSESTIVYKKTIDGFFISRDGGKTYVAGMDKDANIVANVIAAIGISFDWAKGGTLTLGGENDQNGTLNVLNQYGSTVVNAGASGLTARAGNIAGWNISERGIQKLSDDGRTVIAELDWATGLDTNGSGIDIYGNGPLSTSGSRVGYLKTGFVNAGGFSTTELRTLTGISTSDFQEYSKTAGGNAIGAVVAKRFYIYDIRTSSYAANLAVGGTGDYITWSASSSKRYKEDIVPVDLEELDPHKLYGVDVVQYKYKEGYLADNDPGIDKTFIGFIAEDIEEKYPAAATYRDEKVESWNERIMIPPLLNLIQEQKSTIDKLEQRVSQLEKIIGGGKNGYNN